MTATSSRILISSLPLLFLTMISGCSNTTLKDYISIDSQSSIKTDPPGARVVVDDKEVGTSPMVFEGENIFPPHWEGTSYMVKSKLELKKKGCKTVTRIIKDPIPKEINVKLDCQEQYLEPEVQPRSQPQYQPERKQVRPQPMPMSKNAEERLIQIKSLHKKGLISDSENAELRKNILKGL